MKHRLIAGLMAGSVLVAQGAAAQGRLQGSDDGYRVRLDGRYEVEFDDDPLHMAGTSPYGQWLHVRRPAPRAMLVRPRVSFVPELLVSVQKL